jgi:hypothetical protein
VLSESTYNNVVRLAVRVQRFSWAEDFIFTYNKALSPNVQKNARHLNLAELAFSKMAYGMALSQLNEVKTTIPRNHIIAKILLIKTFYEMGEMEPCLSALAAFTVYLSRTRGISTPVKKSCQHFCQLFHRILSQGTTAKQLRIKSQITLKEPLAERQWLLSVFSREHPHLS